MHTLTTLMRTAYERPKDVAMAERVNGTWTPTSTARFLERAENIALALRAMGLQSGDRAAIVSPNCVDWQVANAGILFAACVVVPIFPTQALEHVSFIFGDAAVKAIFVDTAEAAQRLRGVSGSIPIIVFASEGADSLAALELRGAELRQAQPELAGSYERTVGENDLATLIYTSGTTGQPKGVMLTHSNLYTNCRDLHASAFRNIAEGEKVLSVLPFSHIYECTFMYIYMYAGVSVYITRNVDELLNDLRDVRPATMTSVPRIFERVLAGIVGRAQKGSALRAKLLVWALGVGREYIRATTFGPAPNPVLRMQFLLAQRLVLAKLRPLLGLDNLRYFSSGSAPLHLDTALTYAGMGLEILQGYGLTETSPVVTCNTVHVNRFGSVGKPIPNVQVKIAEDGEILVKGPNVMAGYYHDEKTTSEVIKDGWFATGDIGHLDKDGFLYITDRKKELFKTSGGKYLSPARIETAIKRSVYINQVVLIGNDRPHPAALIGPNWDLVRQTLGIEKSVSNAEMSKRDDCIEFLRKEVVENTADLAPFEQVRRIVVLERDLTVEDGELSPTLKVKRRVIETKYAAQIESAYSEELSKPKPVPA